MTTVVSLINMKGGVGKTTLAFNLAWYCAWKANLRVLAIDIDPQSNLSQYFMGAQSYLNYLKEGKCTIFEVFEQFSAPSLQKGSPTPLSPSDVINKLHQWDDGSLIDLVPSRLELAWTLKNPTEKAHLLPQFLTKMGDYYDLVIIDCPPTESILTTAAYLTSRYIIVPVKPEFLATIGLPLLARSIADFQLMHQNQTLELAGIIFSDVNRQPTMEQREAMKDVRKVAKEYGWKVFNNPANHSASYPTGSRRGTPIFLTPYAVDYVSSEFNRVANEFLESIKIR